MVDLLVSAAIGSAGLWSAAHSVGLRRDQHQHQVAVLALEFALVALHAVVAHLAPSFDGVLAPRATLGPIRAAICMKLSLLLLSFLETFLGPSSQIPQALVHEVDAGERRRQHAVLVQVFPPDACAVKRRKFR